MDRVKAFMNGAAKAVVGGFSAGVGGLVVYMQANPVNFSNWELYVAGAVPAFGVAFLTYWTANTSVEAKRSHH
jgi:hypothetical protein